jgi:hypothetical protein
VFVSCHVSTLLTGTGKLKKLVKRQAANKIWEKLQDSPVVSPNVPPGLDDDDEVCAGIRIERFLSVIDHISCYCCFILQDATGLALYLIFTIPKAKLCDSYIAF